MTRTIRLLLAFLVCSLLGAAAIWGGAEASAPGVVQFVYIAFLVLFGAALAAGVRKGQRREIVQQRKGESP